MRIKDVAKRRTKAEWYRIIEEFERGQETQEEASKRLNVGRSAFSYWLYRIRNEKKHAGADGARAEREESLPLASFEFDRYQVTDEKEACLVKEPAIEYELRLLGGQSIIVRGGVNQQEVSVLLSLLMKEEERC